MSTCVVNVSSRRPLGICLFEGRLNFVLLDARFRNPRFTKILLLSAIAHHTGMGDLWRLRTFRCIAFIGHIKHSGRECAFLNSVSDKPFRLKAPLAFAIMAANLTDLRARSGHPKGLAPQLDPRSQTLGNRLAATTKLLELGLKPDVDKKIAYLPTEGRRTIADVAA